MDVLEEIIAERDNTKDSDNKNQPDVVEVNDTGTEDNSQETNDTPIGRSDGSEQEVGGDSANTKEEEDVSTNTQADEQPEEEDVAKRVLSDTVPKSEYNKLMDEYSELKKKQEEYQRGVTQKKNIFANDKIKSFNKFVSKSGIDDYNVFNSVTKANVDEMSDIEALALADIIETPELSSQKKELIEDYKDEYLIDSDDEEISESQKGKSLRRLKREAVRAKEKIRSLHEKLNTDDPEEDNTDYVDPEKKESERIKEWSPIVTEMATNKYFKKIPVDAEIDGKKKILASYDITNEDLDFVESYLKQYTSKPGFEPNTDNVKEAYTSAMKELFISKAPKINKIMYDNIRSEVEKEYREKYAGGKVVNSDKTQGSSNLGKSKADSVVDELLSSMQ